VIAEASTEGNQLGAQLARDPGWLVRQVLSHRLGEPFAARAGGMLDEHQIAELKLGKNTTTLSVEAKTLHGQLDRYAYGPSPVRIGEAELDQARPASVLLEARPHAGDHRPRRVPRVGQAAVARTAEDLRACATERANEQRERKPASRRERTPREDIDAADRAQQREFARRAHNVNLDLGARRRNFLCWLITRNICAPRACGLASSPYPVDERT
jgi:hypothetical protein